MTSPQKPKQVLITGASSGIGAAFARAFAAKGYDLMLVARRLDRLESLGQELSNTHGINATPLSCDLASPEAVDQIREGLAKHNFQPDILINNAGYSIATTYLDPTWEAQENFIHVLVTVPAGLCRLVLPKMVENGWGQIINVSSITAFSPGASGHTLYPAAKSFVLKMSQSLSAEVKDKGVNVTAICPGQTASEFSNANGTKDLVSRSGMQTQSAEQVVKAAINGNEAGREVVVPGWQNKLSVFAMNLLPDSLTAAIIRPVARKFVISNAPQKIDQVPKD